MLLACQPIDIVMRRRSTVHPWSADEWMVVGVVPVGQANAGTVPIESPNESVTRLQLELYADENDGYFENWVAPEPKIFVMWQMQGERPRPLVASVSYAEGTRMLDSGDSTDGVAMPPAVHQWLAAYLTLYFRPARRGPHGHRSA
jgi:Protein of unknown function (DUF3305)